MSIKALSDINEMHIDVLREIANIGSGNAASALSKMLGQPVDIAIPDIEIKAFNEACDVLGGPEEVMVGVLLMLSKSIQGMIMFLLPVDVACDLVNSLTGLSIKRYNDIDEMGISVIRELANIMSGSFVGAISDMTGIPIDISPPEYTLDMLGSIMSVPSIYYAKISDTLLLIQNELEIAGNKTRANVMLLPDMPSLEKLMTSLGVEI